MSSPLSDNQRALRIRKRPKKTSSKAKTAQKLFGNNTIKELSIPAVADHYNHFMGTLDKFNHLTA
jgi:hypothetical protein